MCSSSESLAVMCHGDRLLTMPNGGSMPFQYQNIHMILQIGAMFAVLLNQFSKPLLFSLLPSQIFLVS